MGRPDENSGVATPDDSAHRHPAPPRHGGRRAAWTALAVCISVLLLSDLAQSIAREALIAPGYAALVAGLTLAAALPVCLVACLFPRPLAAALGLWVAAEFIARAADLAVGLPVGLPLGTAIGAITALGLWRVQLSAFEAGLGVAACLWIGFVAAGPLVRELPGPVAEMPDWLAGALLYLLFGTGLLLNSNKRLLGASIAIAAPSIALAALLGAVAIKHPSADRSAFVAPRVPSVERPPNLLVLILDTVRADHLSLYGYERDTTPNLARLAAEHNATVFPRAYSPSNWTAPAHLSLLTGQLPSEHQVHCGNEIHLLHQRHPAVDPPETLAERLAGAGFRSAGVIANPNALAVSGTGRGFDLWALVPPPRPFSFLGEALRRRFTPYRFRGVEHPLATARMVNAQVMALLDHCDAGGCLVVANYIDVHAPYAPSSPFVGHFNGIEAVDVPTQLNAHSGRESTARAMAAYDEELLGLDAALGELFASLERHGYFADSWVFVTSDHGEAFLEHAAVHHASSLHDEQIRVPLIAFYPEGDFVPQRRDPVGLLDLTATLSAIATGDGLGEGRDLRDPNAAERAIRSEFFGCSHPTNDWGPEMGMPARSVIVGDRKLLEVGERSFLYALDIDPNERRDRDAEEPTTSARLRSELPPLERRSDRLLDDGGVIAPSDTEALRALGYIE